MDPNTLILTALTTGAAASLKETTSTAIQDAYVGLKTLILRKFEGKPKAQTILTEHEEDPDTFEKPLRKVLSDNNLDQDQEIIAAAHQLMTLVQPQQVGMGKYNIQNTGNVQGQVMENNGSITMNFGNMSKE